MKFKTGGMCMALPPLSMVNVKKGDEVRALGMISYNGQPYILAICDRLNASLVIKRKRLVL